MKKSIHTQPKLCKASQGWYVYFRYNKKLFRYKFGINYIKDLNAREKEANALIAALKRKLSRGWNPMIAEIPELGNDMSLVDAIKFCLSKKKDTLATKSFLGYSCTSRFIIKSIDALNLTYIDIKDVKRAHIRAIIDHAKKRNNWSNKARNKHLNYLKAILSELIDFDIIEFNPAHKIKNLKVMDSRSNITPTPKEHARIKECLSNDHPNFYIFILTLFHTGIRPNEILQIKLEMIDLVKQEIILPPEITKTGKERIVPINDHLADHFRSIDIQIYPDGFYLFGSYREPGKGNVGKYLDFIPGPTRIKTDTATNRWKRIVKKGLGIQVNMYAYKHAGANAKILAGIDLDVLRELYGHNSKLMTMRYAKVVKEVYRNEIIKKSPKF